MVDYTCDYAETTLLSTMGGIDKGEKNIMQNVGQQKMRTKKIAQLQEKHPSRQQP